MDIANPRFQRQLQLETDLVQFSADAVETSELLAALQQGVRKRYDLKATKVLEKFEELEQALSGLQDHLYEPEPDTSRRFVEEPV